MNNYYIHKERAVAFLDVLGFRAKLLEFEKEAIENHKNGYALEEGGNNQVYYSPMANDFINTFNNAISKLNKDLFNYYLFSDNICITGKKDHDNSSLIDLMVVITELYYEFAQKGYFLRGGIDYGLFVDQEFIAVGVPLARAYEIESKQAIFPRIVLSDDFVKQFETYTKAGEAEINNVFVSSLIKKNCEINYINVFNYVFSIEDKEDFLNNFKNRIIENLEINKNKESIYIKFDWLAKEYNYFIDNYTNKLAFLDNDFEPTADFISSIKKLKI